MWPMLTQAAISPACGSKATLFQSGTTRPKDFVILFRARPVCGGAPSRDRGGSGHASPLALALGAELTAGGKDVAAARHAHRRGETGVVEDTGERLNALHVRGLVRRARPRIERDEIGFGVNALEQA